MQRLGRSSDGADPRDLEAHYGGKVTADGQRDWIGDRAHQTETCDETSPNVIVQVVTRPASQQDIDDLDGIHKQLARAISASSTSSTAATP
ncbi:hypothetical protein C4B68_38280 [Streptomyces dengpaensis]|uniref:Uncharacterized protein n=1 Tax=Streptomyces dengpaensis TaxID=2049881 RepID=A0ABN5IBY7_9ACTN|nr:hypothetical protein C4B68_38280 [Streptomyces dengpaensis]